MKLVILDRDGTINEEGVESVETPEAWLPLPGALEAIAKLNHAGWHVVVAANQANLGRGLIEVATLNALHARMHKMLAAVGGRVDAVFYCPHAPDEACRCRKPVPGLFEQIGERYGVDLKGMPTVGDSEEDLVAGAAVGCQPHLVLTGRGAQYQGRPLPASFPAGTQVHRDLAAFAEFLATSPEPARVSAAPRP
ncbi:MAG: D-glycero-beta-D-manno-heptose 1,7-bisphosphate 7-phosphatase [Rhodoferax sp.]|nr:D-glycero-beta-D-manno-heptose 1,7-bisphosphate 7-phosphatase [Rhodoferax sp.]